MLYEIPANVIREWCFCPRVVYYVELLNISTHKPLWVEQGENKHLDFKSLLRRRRFSKIGITEGNYHYDYPLSSAKYGLKGTVDLIVECENSVYPFDYKTGLKIHRGQIMQMIAYAIMAQESFTKPVPFGIFLYGDKGKMVKTVDITNDKILELLKICDDIRNMIDAGVKPHSNASLPQCMQCQYFNHCNDRGE